MAKMDQQELKSILASEMNTALGADGGKLSLERRTALEYYEGLPFGNEIEGRSQVVTRNVLEAVEWVLPRLLEIFTASDKIVEFEPYRPGDEAAARQATDFINYIITKDNNGFMILHDWFKDALTQKMGYIKVFWDTQKVYTVNTFTGLSDDEFQALSSSDDVEVLEQKTYPNPDPSFAWFSEDSPEPIAPNLHDVKLRSWITEGRVKIQNLPPESVLVSRRAPSTILDGKHFVCHRELKRVTDLVEMGFDEDLIDEAKGFDEQEYNSERISRFTLEDDWPMSGDRTDDAMREVWLEESYIAIDFDGDGVAELRKITSSGRGAVIFDNEEVDEVPVISICPIPMPHKHIGLGLSDLVMDLQLIKSTLMRQGLDNLYLSNNPRMLIAEPAMSEESYDDLLTCRPGGLVRVNDVQGVVPLTVPFVAQSTFEVLSYIDQVQEVRTGVSPHNQTISADTLNGNQTATGIQLVQQAAAQRVELFARIFAEQGVKTLAKRILGLVTKHQQEARVIRLTGNWVPMDPRQWNQSMDINISVGLGTGNRDGILQKLLQVLQIQQQIVSVQGGVQGPLVTVQNIHDVLTKLTETSGFKQSFFMDPSQMPPGGQPPQHPSPEMMQAQAQMQAEQVKAKADAQNNQMRVQADLEANKAKAQQQMQLEAFQAQHSMQIEQQRAEHAMQLEQMREQARQALTQQQAQLAVSDPDVRANL